MLQHQFRESTYGRLPFLMFVGRWFLGLVLVSVLSSVLSFAAPAAKFHPNIILITLDTTRADRMDFLGSRRGLTPNLDVLAREGLLAKLRRWQKEME